MSRPTRSAAFASGLPVVSPPGPEGAASEGAASEGAVRPVARALPEPEAAPSLVAAIALRFESSSQERERSEVLVRLGASEVSARLDPSVHPSVVATAVTRGERLLVQREGDAWVVVGALRTSPTPGIEEAEEYVIRAGRVRVKATHEFTVASGTASLAVRAYGMVETVAEQITSRASAVHKIIGRMLHLN
jgi:hypothetical protein